MQTIGHYFRTPLERLSSLRDSDVVDIMDQIPVGWMSTSAKEFAASLIRSNRDRLLRGWAFTPRSTPPVFAAAQPPVNTVVVNSLVARGAAIDVTARRVVTRTQKPRPESRNVHLALQYVMQT